MAPIPLKRSASSAQSLTRGGAPEACGLVREAVRASAAASLASPPLVPTPPQPQPQKQTDRVQAEVRFGPPVEGLALDAAPAPGVLCWEEIDGRRWSYVVDVDGTPGRARRGSSVRAVPMQSPVAPLEDGAGRVGKMLFARQGKKFDYDLKQLRFAGDLLMELGAGVELATATVPHLFLPLACAANVVKNVAAVTSTSTRTPIYKAYARGENIGDVTAKGECVGNIADLLGTGLSILISKRNPSLVASFAFLSCGYVFSAYQEVKSVVLNTLNRARFTVAVESFIKTGHVPSLKEGNSKESIFRPPWSKHTPVVIGPRFCDAFQEPSSFFAIQPLFEKERYMVTYNPSKDKIYALLKDQAKSDDILKAAFHAHVLLYFIRLSSSNQALRKLMNSNQSTYGVPLLPTNADFLAHMEESCKIVSSSYAMFKRKAAEQGWIMSESLLNPGRARLLSTKEL
ncbi:protein root UVB sensitive 6 isoform X3 [Musa acuminata AAA Group]|uniref:protein root UVB sensitive 6 isoform X3 n=1 Tax=Musa acuminata AAA Group TaxID=214697 RepID=UPI0031DC77AE